MFSTSVREIFHIWQSAGELDFCWAEEFGGDFFGCCPRVNSTRNEVLMSLKLIMKRSCMKMSLSALGGAAGVRNAAVCSVPRSSVHGAAESSGDHRGQPAEAVWELAAQGECWLFLGILGTHCPRAGALTQPVAPAGLFFWAVSKGVDVLEGLWQIFVYT